MIGDVLEISISGGENLFSSLGFNHKLIHYYTEPYTVTSLCIYKIKTLRKVHSIQIGIGRG